jgi:hypothetical protein
MRAKSHLDDLAHLVEMVRRDIEATPLNDPKRERLARKLRQLQTAMDADKWAASNGLQPPK